MPGIQTHEPRPPKQSALNLTTTPLGRPLTLFVFTLKCYNFFIVVRTLNTIFPFNTFSSASSRDLLSNAVMRISNTVYSFTFDIHVCSKQIHSGCVLEGWTAQMSKNLTLSHCYHTGTREFKDKAETLHHNNCKTFPEIPPLLLFQTANPIFIKNSSFDQYS